MKNTIYLLALLSILFFVPTLWAQDFVVVKHNVKFFPTVDSSIPFLHTENQKGFLTLELLEEKEKRVRIKFSPKEKFSCYTAYQRSFPPIDLYLWVDRDDLEKVTTQVLNWTFKDGSEVELAAGLAIDSGTVFTGTSPLPIKVPKDKIGFSFRKNYLYLPEKYLNRPFQMQMKSIVSKRGIKYNSNKYFQKSIYQKAIKIGRFYEVKNRCLRVRGRLKGKVETSLILSQLTASRPPLSFFTPKIIHGARAFSENEEEVGEVIYDIPLGQEYKVSGKFVCKSIPVLSENPRICVMSSDVANIPLKPSKLAKVHLDAKMKFGQMKIRGDNPAMVKKTFRRKANAFKYCYERELQKNSTIAGTVSIQAKIGPDGTVKTVTIIQSDMKTPTVEACVLRVTKRTRFIKSKTQTTANISFWFSLK